VKEERKHLLGMGYILFHLMNGLDPLSSEEWDRPFVI